MRYLKSIILALFLILVVIVQFAIIPYTGLYGKINLVLIFAFLVIYFNHQKKALIWLVLAGVFLDVFSFNNYFIYTTALIIAAMVFYLIIAKLISQKNNFTIFLFQLIFLLLYFIVILPFFWSARESLVNFFLWQALTHTTTIFLVVLGKEFYLKYFKAKFIY